MSLRLSHYVFSSLNGYRPVYVSPDLPQEFNVPLEALAKGVYLTAQRTDLYMWLRPEGSDDICAVKGLRNGTDRAGRSRSCVHAIVFSASDAAGSWYFSPFSLPETVFVSPDSSLQALGNELLVECELDKPKNPRPPEDLARGTLASLLALMLHPSATAVILDERGDALKTLRSLVWLVPPPARRHLTLSAWTAPPDVPALGRVRLTVLSPKSDSLKELAKPDVIIEYPSGKITEEADDDDDDEATFNVFAEFVASNLVNDHGFDRMKKLAGLLERHPPTLRLTQERYRHVIEGFSRIESNVEEWGSVQVNKDRKASLSAVKDFALAGMPSLSLDILDAVVSSAVDHYDMDAGSIKSALAKLKTDIDPSDRRFAEVCGFLAGQLEDVADALGGGS